MSPDEMAFVAVTPDHIDVALHAAFALHAGKSALRLILLVVIRISSPSHSINSPDKLSFIIIYFIIFNIYLLNERRRTRVARVAPNLPIMWPALCPPPILRVTNNYLC